MCMVLPTGRSPPASAAGSRPTRAASGADRSGPDGPTCSSGCSRWPGFGPNCRQTTRQGSHFQRVAWHGGSAPRKTSSASTVSHPSVAGDGHRSCPRSDLPNSSRETSPPVMSLGQSPRGTNSSIRTESGDWRQEHSTPKESPSSNRVGSVTRVLSSDGRAFLCIYCGWLSGDPERGAVYGSGWPDC
jgi:hypothetical protein